MRGVIDRFESTVALIVLDDKQQVLWPRSALPVQAQPGDAVRLQLIFSATARSQMSDSSAGCAASTENTAAELPVEVRYDSSQDQWLVELVKGRVLRWPAEASACAETDQSARLRLEVDIEDTAARRQRVQGLLDDMFGAPRS